MDTLEIVAAVHGAICIVMAIVSIRKGLAES